MKYVLTILSLAASLAACNRFVDQMTFLNNYEYYGQYSDPADFVRRLDIPANNYISVMKKINDELDAELREASNYDLMSDNQSVNQDTAELINKMQARQIVTDMILFQIEYCYRMYVNGSAKYTGKTAIPLYEDKTFDFPMNKMVLYEWVNNMNKLLKEVSRIGEKISETWKTVRENINGTAINEEEAKKNATPPAEEPKEVVKKEETPEPKKEPEPPK